MIRCGVCGVPMAEPKDWGVVVGHPQHTDAELAETKAAVEAAAKVLTALVLLRMAAEAAA